MKSYPALASLLLVLLAAGSPVLAEESEEKPSGDSATTAVPAAPDVSPEATQTIEQILREKEDLLTGKRFNYDPAGRRDPFRSLIEEVRRDRSQKLKGIRGMGISEVDLVGVVRNPGGDIAFFHGSDNKGYFLKVGDELFDGRIISIDPATGTVTFRQQVDDPRQIKPYRDIVKRLVPTEEEETP